MCAQKYKLYNDKLMPYYFLNFDRAAAEPIMAAAAEKRAEREKALEVFLSLPPSFPLPPSLSPSL